MAFLVGLVVAFAVFTSCTFDLVGLTDLESPESQEVVEVAPVVDSLALCQNEKTLQVSQALAQVRALRQAAIDAASAFYADTANHELLLQHYEANAAYSCAEEVFRGLEAMPVDRFVQGSCMYQTQYQKLWDAKYQSEVEKRRAA